MVVALLIVSVLLTGCTSGDDLAVESGSSADGGANVEGRVLTVNLDEISGARVAFFVDEEEVGEDETNDRGEYSITGLEAGDYRIEVTADCCRDHARTISLSEGAMRELSFQLEPLGEADMQDPYSLLHDWTGLFTCGAGTPIATWSTCSTVGDPNHDWDHGWDVGQGLASIVVAMDWQPVGAASGDQLMIIYHCREGCSGEHVRATGTPPLEFRVDGSFPDDAWVAGFEVYPPLDFTVIYQQEFTVYWEEFYYQKAPDGHSALPDN